LEIDAVLSSIETATEFLVDIGHAEFQRNGGTERACFAQLAGAGLDARSVELANWQLKKRIGRFAYIVAGLRALGGAHPPITISSGTVTETGALVLIGNGKLYGGHYPVFHKSNLRDGLLDALVFKSMGWRSIAGHLWPMLTRRPFLESRTIYIQGSSLTLSSNARVPFQIDGEPAGELPAIVSVRSKKLRVLAPSIE
jgi:diacylglycerol kinase family enzyme